MRTEMEKKVYSLWCSLLSKEDEESIGEAVIGAGNTGDYAYDSELIKSQDTFKNLYSLLNKLDIEKDDLHFYDLSKKKDGTEWTELHQPLDFFASMLNAAKILKFEEEPVYYTKEKNNPKIVIKQELEKRVKTLWKSLLAPEIDPYRDECCNLIGKGNTGDYAYSFIKICEDKKIEELYEIVDELDTEKDELRFYDLLKKKDGTEWTKVHQDLDFLASMLNAAGILEYEEEPQYYTKEKTNPKIKIRKLEDSMVRKNVG